MNFERSDIPLPPFFINWSMVTSLLNILTFKTKLYFLDVTYPQDIIKYICQLYIQCRKNYIETNILTCNLCPCNDEDCLVIWYDDMQYEDVKKNWGQYHCSTKKCHTIIYKSSWHKGFLCNSCNKKYCSTCRYKSKNNLCIHCPYNEQLLKIIKDNILNCNKNKRDY